MCFADGDAHCENELDHNLCAHLDHPARRQSEVIGRTSSIARQENEDAVLPEWQAF